jgi:exonuclease VII small subunit
MEDYNEILIQHIGEQIALEEHLCQIIGEQIIDLEDSEYHEAKQILKNTIAVLEENFQPLNDMLSKLEKGIDSKSVNANGLQHSHKKAQNNRRISRMLRDDYSALNLITMSNTLLHTTALTLKHEEVAQLALQQLKQLAPLVIKLGEIFPSVVFKELNMGTSNFDPTIAEIALRNTKKAWCGID